MLRPLTWGWRPLLKWHLRHRVRVGISTNPGKVETADMSESTYMKHLEAMRSEGLVERVKTSNPEIKIFKLTEKGERALELDQKIIDTLGEIQMLGAT